LLDQELKKKALHETQITAAEEKKKGEKGRSGPKKPNCRCRTAEGRERYLGIEMNVSAVRKGKKKKRKEEIDLRSRLVPERDAEKKERRSAPALGLGEEKKKKKEE